MKDIYKKLSKKVVEYISEPENQEKIAKIIEKAVKDYADKKSKK